MKRIVMLLMMAVALTGITAAEEDGQKNGWAGFDKGFRFESADGKNTLQISNRVQFRLTQEDPDVGDSQASFRLRRFKFKMTGKVMGNVKYKLQANFAGDSAELEDASIQYTKHRMAQLWVGQGKIFFHRQGLTSSGSQQFVDRSILSNELEAARDQGIALIGQNKKKTFEYQVGVYNGNGINTSSNDDNNFQYTGRVVFTPLGEYKLSESALDRPEKSRLAVGAKVLVEKVDGALGLETDRTISGVEFAYKLSGFNAVTEYYQLRADLTTMAMTTPVDIDAYYVQVAYLFAQRPIEVALRFANVSPDVVGPSIDRTEQGIAVNWYMNQHNHKLQFDYRMLENDVDPTQDSNEARVQLQLAF